MTKVKKVDNGMFNAIKMMLKYGAPYNEVADYYKLSPTTIARVNSADSYEEYLNIIRAIYTKTKKKDENNEEPKTPGGTLSNNYQLTRMFEMLRQMNENLVLISNKMAYIVEELTSTPAAK